MKNLEIEKNLKKLKPGLKKHGNTQTLAFCPHEYCNQRYKKNDYLNSLFSTQNCCKDSIPASWADVSHVSSFAATGSIGLGVINNCQYCI